MNWTLFKRKIRFTYQKLTRGFSDEVTWNLDVELAIWLLPRLKTFKDVSITVPYPLTEQEWSEVLDKIILSLELIRTQFNVYNENQYTPEERETKIQEGLDLLSKYFRSLWW